jgi:uncharacterized protein YqhQ
MSDQPLRLGGMALENGLFLHGPTAWAVAVRDDEGRIRTATGTKRRVEGRAGGLPLARGVLRMGEMFGVLASVRRALPEARFPFTERRVMAAMTLSATAVAALRARGGRPTFRTELASALAGLAPSAVALGSRTLSGYHGAEHKTIGAYEHGGTAAEATKEHERCGSHLVGPLLLTTAVANAVTGRLPERSRRAARATGSLAALGVAVEVFAWMDRNRERSLARALARPGHALQRFASTSEPTPDQLEVAERALDELLRAEGAPPRRA